MSGGHGRGRLLAFALSVGAAAQLAPLYWHGTLHHGGYTANEDERYYAALLRHAAQGPLDQPNPFDRERSGAAPTTGRLLPLAVAVPARLRVVPSGFWMDLSRWLASSASAALCVRLGAAAASPALGAAAAVLVLLDPGTYYAKPLVALAGIGAPAPDDPQPLFYSRLGTPSYTMPLFLLTLLGLMGRARGRRARTRTALAIGLVGASGHVFTWTSAGAAAAAGALWPPPRWRRLALPVAAGPALLLALVWLGGRGEREVAFEDLMLRLGCFRTRRPQLLTHSGFWAGAAAAAALAVAPLRIRPGARRLGAAMLGVWALALLHTPLTGWDIQSFHFAYALGPLSILCWCVLVWHGWRRLGRPRAPMAAGALAVAVVTFAGPFWALRGLGNAVAEGQPGPELRAALANGAIPDGAVVLVPAAWRADLAARYRGVSFAASLQAHFAVPDSLLWARTVCGSVLAGEDSAEVRRIALKPRPGRIPHWPYGRPSGVPLTGIRSYFEIFPVLADSLGAAVADAARRPERLRAACGARPDFVLAAGWPRIGRALRAAAQLGGRVRRTAPDGNWAWLELPR